jgi:iron complex transport system ATP-binding protein
MLKINELAKYRAVMSQLIELGFPLSVEEVVMMARYPHFIFAPDKKDFDTCNEVINKLDLSIFKDRNYLTLSGREKSRVQFAKVLPQIWRE